MIPVCIPVASRERHFFAFHFSTGGQFETAPLTLSRTNLSNSVKLESSLTINLSPWKLMGRSDTAAAARDVNHSCGVYDVHRLSAERPFNSRPSRRATPTNFIPTRQLTTAHRTSPGRNLSVFHTAAWAERLLGDGRAAASQFMFVSCRTASL